MIFEYIPYTHIDIYWRILPLDTQEQAHKENHASFTLSEDQTLRRSYVLQKSLVPTGKESNRSDEVLADDGRAATAFFSGGSVLRHYGRMDKAETICKAGADI